MGVVGFILGRLVHWGAPWGLSGSSGIAGFIGVRRDHQGSLLSLGCALVVVGYIRGRLVHWRTSWGHRVHLVHPGPSLGLVWCTQGVVGFN